MISQIQPSISLRTIVCGHKVTELVKRFGVPLCMHDVDDLNRRLSLPESFDELQCIVNPNSPAFFLDRIKTQGMHIRVNNVHAIRRAIASGFSMSIKPINPPAARAVFAGDFIDRDSLSLIKEHAIHVHCGSPDMIDQIGQCQPGANITLTINPLSQSTQPDQCLIAIDAALGIPVDQIEDCLFKADQYGITVTGLEVLYTNTIGNDWEVCGNALEQAAMSVGRTVSMIGIVDCSNDMCDNEHYRRIVLASDSIMLQVKQRLSDRFGTSLKSVYVINPAMYNRTTIVAEIRAVKKLGGTRCYAVDLPDSVVRDLHAHHLSSALSISPRDGSNHDRPLVDAVIMGHHAEAAMRRDDWLQRLESPIAVVGDFVVADAPGGLLDEVPQRSKPWTEIMVENGQCQAFPSDDAYDGLQFTATRL